MDSRLPPNAGNYQPEDLQGEITYNTLKWNEAMNVLSQCPRGREVWVIKYIEGINEDWRRLR